jgi:hypothetical protein
MFIGIFTNIFRRCDTHGSEDDFPERTRAALAMRRQRERRTAPQQRTPPRRARPERRLRTRARFYPGLLASSCYLISGELPKEYHPEFTLKKLTRSSSSGRKSQSRAATVHISFSASSFAVKRTIFQTCS